MSSSFLKQIKFAQYMILAFHNYGIYDKHDKGNKSHPLELLGV